MMALFFAAAQAAWADNYATVKAGYTNVADADFDFQGLAYDADFDAGWLVGVALGTRMEDMRVEGEVETRLNDIEVPGLGEDEYKSTSLLVNGYYDISAFSGLTPYIGAGIGFAYQDVVSDDDWVFAYQGTAGIAMAVSPAMDLDFAYRYFATNDAQFDGVEIDYESHNATVGVRFYF